VLGRVRAWFLEDRRVYLADEPVRLEVFGERIRQAMLSRTDKQVFLRGDGAIRYDDLMAVMDTLKKAGVVNVGLVTKLPGEREMIEAATNVRIARSRVH